MGELRDMLAQTARSLDAFTHPRVSVAWQDLELVYRRVHNPSPDLNGDIIGKKLEDIIGNGAQARKLTAMKRRILKSGVPYHGLTTVPLSGRDHIFDLSIEPTYDAGGAMDGLISVNIDVTDLVAAREHLREANDRLVKLLDDALDADAAPRRHKHSDPIT